MFRTYSLLLLFSLSSNAFALPCEHERQEYINFNTPCEELSLASHTANRMGGAFSFCAFDLHLLPCTTLIAAAQSTCLGKNEKERVLASCESPSDTFRRQDKEVIQASRIGKVFHDLLAALSNEAYQSE